MGGAHGSRRTRRGPGTGAALAALAGVTVGVLLVAFLGDGLTLPSWPWDDEPSVGASADPSAVPDDPEPTPAGPVLPPATAAAVAPPSAAGLAAALGDPLTAAALGRRVGVVVADPVTGATLYSSEAGTPFVPASTAKLLTAASALHLLGPDAVLRTRVVAGGSGAAGTSGPTGTSGTTGTSATTRTIVLVGGGDPSLRPTATTSTSGAESLPASPGLATLAARTADALRAEGSTTVRLELDDTAFSGPRTGPGWLPADVAAGVATRVSALTLDLDADGEPTPAVEDPTTATGAEFRRALEAEGITVRSVARGAAAPDAAELAAVESATVSRLVEHMLLDSDNDYAEALAHLAGAAAGAGGSFAGGVAAAEQTLTWLGLDPAAARLVDGSGLSTRNRITPALIGSVLLAATDGSRPELTAIGPGLPAAGIDGTLADRFDERGTRPARGAVQAKTGTLTGVNSLAGTVLDADGRLLVLVVLADRTSTDTLAAREALDRVAAALGACGCP